MGEGRELWERLANDLNARADQATESRNPDVQHHGLTLLAVADSIRRTLLATQPDAVPELPEWIEENDGRYVVALLRERFLHFFETYSPDDLDRIAEAARILAARERARRAGR